MPATQRQKQKLETRNHLIQTAMKQFASDGLTATRTSDIAAAAGVSHGTVFAHFPTREELLMAVIEEFGTRITTRLHELVETHSGLKQVLAAHLTGVGEYEEFYTRLVSEGRLLNASCRNAYVMIQSSISFHILQAAEPEMEEGRIRPMPTELLFNTWIGLVHHYLVNGDLFAPGGSVLERYGKLLIEHYMGLILEKGSGEG